jgi:hypothetical protein
MILLVWRGWGLLGIIALFLPLASCVGFLEAWPGLAFLFAGLTLFGGGIVCRYFGRRWNRIGNEHTLYNVPLQVWGWIYIAVGGLMAVVGIVGAIRKGGFGA